MNRSSRMTATLWALLGAALLTAACSSRDTPATFDGPKPKADGPKADAPKPIADGPKIDAPKPIADGPKVDAPPPLCPPQLPTPSAACPREGLICEYGNDPRCLAFAECSASGWNVATPKCAGPDPSCPATRLDAAGKTCSVLDAYCNYDGLTCDCTNCTKYPVVNCSGPLTWHCEAPNPTPTCPAARPLLGTACPQDSQFCAYGCEPDVSRKCAGGVWVKASAPGGCPVSTRRAKRDIAYLDAKRLARVAEQARKLRLATYRYKDPAYGERLHLGYILEDSPKALATDRSKQQVDLYSFASMTLALAQQQQRQIDALRRELDALRKRLGRRQRR